MRKLIDLTGQRFGKLTVVKYMGNSKWEAVCDCGKRKIVSGGHLKDGHTTSCGCAIRSSLNDLTGKQFGRLTVIRRAANSKKGESRWLCRCVCGNEITVYGRGLTSGTTKSCGCLKSPNIIGNRYGQLLVVKEVETPCMHENPNEKHYECICDCGKTVILRRYRIPQMKSCGCLAKISNKTHGHYLTRIYKTWHNMKQRCYNPKNIRYAHYGARV